MKASLTLAISLGTALAATTTTQNALAWPVCAHPNIGHGENYVIQLRPGQEGASGFHALPQDRLDWYGLRGSSDHPDVPTGAKRGESEAQSQLELRRTLTPEGARWRM